MLISEKGLCKAMSDAAAHGGYKLRFDYDGDKLSVLTDEWLVVFESGEVPRKVLGLIVEHFGYLPRGGCYCIRKTKEGFDVQTYMNDTYSIDYHNFTMTGSEPTIFTGITVWDRELYISESGTLRGAKPVHFGLLNVEPHPRMCEGKSLMFADEDGAVFIAVCDNSFLQVPKQAIWNSLERIDWWKAKDAENKKAPREDYEQTELEERDRAGDE